MTASDFFKQVKEKLLFRRQVVNDQLKLNTKNDPFVQEYKDEGFRNLDELGEEAVDEREHEVNQAVKAELSEEKEQIDTALEKLDKGKYGVCEVCGKDIPKERLAINPTATKCVECEAKSQA